MNPDETIHRRIVAVLDRSGADHWFCCLHQLATIDLEMTRAGPACTEGESRGATIALWWQGKNAVASLPLDAAATDGRHLAGTLRQLERLAGRKPALAPPEYPPGSDADWNGDWAGQVAGWRRTLARQCRENDGWSKRFDLHLEQHRCVLVDRKGTRREVRRHLARVRLSVESVRPVRTAWTMTVALPSPEVCDLGDSISGATLHAKARAQPVCLPAGIASVCLDPFAVAQLLASWNDRWAMSAPPTCIPGINPGRPVGKGPAAWAGESIRFIVPGEISCALFPASQWVDPGRTRPGRNRDGGLHVRHFEELLDQPLAGGIRGMAVAGNTPGRSPRRTGRVRIDIPWDRVWRAVQTEAARGEILGAFCFGETEYHVPSLTLGRLRWQG